MLLLRYIRRTFIVYRLFKSIFDIDATHKYNRNLYVDKLKEERNWFKLIIFHILSFIVFGIEDTTRVLNDVTWWIKYRTTQRYHIINTKLPPRYYDSDTRLTEGCFSIFVDFIEEEYVHDIRLWNNLPDKMSIKEVCEFALTFRPDDKPLYDLYLYCKNRTNHSEVELLDEKMYELETKMLIEIVKLRNRLWT